MESVAQFSYRRSLCVLFRGLSVLGPEWIHLLIYCKADGQSPLMTDLLLRKVTAAAAARKGAVGNTGLLRTKQSLNKVALRVERKASLLSRICQV
jgi:hypothetical protein